MSVKCTFFKRSVLVALLFVASLFGAGGNAVEIIRPYNKSIIDVNSVTVVIKIDDHKVDKLKIVSETGDVYEIKVTSSKDVYCKNIILEYGVNTIIVRAYANGKKLFQKMLEIFYRFPPYRGYKYPPGDFKKNYFHTTKSEKLCSRCHKMNSNEKKGIAFENPKESNCYNCHKTIFLGKKYAHAPSVNWVCSSCHNKSRSPYTKYPVPKKLNQSCFDCHKKFRKKFFPKKYKHEPVLVGRCNRCHDPHATPNKYFVRLKVKKLCTTCHGDKVITTKKPGSKCAASSNGSCTDCHNPHASKRPFFYEPRRHEVKEEKKKKKGLWIDE